MNKKLLISVFSFIIILVLWLFVPAPAYPDILEVLPSDYDFGDVEVGTTVTTIISMTNANGSTITVESIAFQAGGSDDFSIVSAPPTPFDLAIGEMVDVVVAFSPSAEGYSSAILQIDSTDWTNPTQAVPLGGVGVAVQPPPVSIQAILDFFDSSVMAGTLVGTGPGESAQARLLALRKTIETAGKLIERGEYGATCQILLPGFRRCDGLLRPPDFVEGAARAELNAMIGQLIADLGC